MAIGGEFHASNGQSQGAFSDQPSELSRAVVVESSFAIFRANDQAFHLCVEAFDEQLQLAPNTR